MTHPYAPFPTKTMNYIKLISFYLYLLVCIAIQERKYDFKTDIS